MVNDPVVVEHKILRGRHVFFTPGVGGFYVADRDEDRARAKVSVAIGTMKRHGALAAHVDWALAGVVPVHAGSHVMGLE